jgi:hypothetical protein
MMASTSLLTAIVERLVEKTKKKYPGVDIMKKPPKAKKSRRPRRKDLS